MKIEIETQITEIDKHGQPVVRFRVFIDGASTSGDQDYAAEFLARHLDGATGNMTTFLSGLRRTTEQEFVRAACIEKLRIQNSNVAST